MAIRKYIKTPRILIEVVTKEPVAMAASISNLLRISGMSVPKVADMTMHKKIDSPTTTPKSRFGEAKKSDDAKK